MAPGVVFVDLDRTLIDVNSGELWAKHEWRMGRLGIADALRAVWWLGRYALGDDGVGPALDHAASLYEGMPEHEMRTAVEAWFAVEVLPRLRPRALETLQTHRDRGESIVLATSSSQFVAACARTAWQLDDVVSTCVEVQDGVITGALAVSAFGHHKLAQCELWADQHGVSLADATFYTDSYSDLALLEKVGHPVIVHPDRRLARLAAARDWPVLDWGQAS